MRLANVSGLVLFTIPYWRRLLLSLVFGGLSALLWSSELALTYRLTIIFGEHHTVPNYVRHEIDHSSTLVTNHSAECFMVGRRVEAPLVPPYDPFSTGC